MIMKLKSKKSLKYFIGIDIPDHIKDEIVEFRKTKLDKFQQYVNWIDFNEFHITLAYIGLITEEQLARLITVSDNIIASPFTIHLQGLGFFPPHKNHKTVWLGIGTGREKIKIFGERIRQIIANKAGLIPKDRFFPHITVCKFKKGVPKIYNDLYKTVRDNWDYPFGAFQIKNFHLYRITKHGYEYNHEVKLKGRLSILL